jgi:hypothetical protein
MSAHQSITLVDSLKPSPQPLPSKDFIRISEEEFWDAMMYAPIKRMGYSNGPGAVFHGEPYCERVCRVTGQITQSMSSAHFVLKTPDGKGAFYEYDGDVTLEEFKDMCRRIIPGVGPCGWGLGKDL